MKIKALLLMLLIAALLLSGCGKKKNDTEATDTADASVTTTETAPDTAPEDTDAPDTKPADTEPAETEAETEKVADKIIEGVTFKLFSDDINEVSQHTSAQNKYLAGHYADISKFAAGTKALDAPEPLLFSWKVTSDEVPKAYKIAVGKKADLSDAIYYESKEKKCNVFNLELGTEYYWSVTAIFDDGIAVSDVSSFKTASDTPRNMKVDGVKNFRDLGGYTTLDGGRVKQGLIFRCGRLTENNTAKVIIEKSGIDYMNNVLHIKSEIDLRNVSDGESGYPDGNGKCALGDNVTYFACPMTYGGNILELNTEEIKHVFSILSDESNYPLFFHCSIGTDRTGMIAFLVNGLLGVSEKELYQDYLLSNFANIGGSRSYTTIQSYLGKVAKEHANMTVSEQIYAYLTEIGVPAEQLDSVISILKEK